MITLTLTEAERKQVLFELNSAVDVLSESEDDNTDELYRLDMLITKFENVKE